MPVGRGVLDGYCYITLMRVEKLHPLVIQHNTRAATAVTV